MPHARSAGAALVVVCSVFAPACVGILGDFDTGDSTGTSDGAVVDGALGDGSSRDSGTGRDGATTDGSSDASSDAPLLDAQGIDVVLIDAAPYQPTALPGLVVWLDSDAALMIQSQNKVVGWTDKSPRGNNGKNQLPTTSPVLNVANPTFNNRPSVHFDGKSYLYILNNPSLAIGDGDFVIAVVASVTPGTTSLETLIEKHDTATPYAGPALYATPAKLDGVMASGNGVVLSAPVVNDGNAHFFLLWRTGGILTVATEKGTTSGNVTGVPAGSGSKDLSIGFESSNGTLANYLTGDVAEIVIGLGNESKDDVAALQKYLVDKYKL